MTGEGVEATLQPGPDLGSFALEKRTNQTQRGGFIPVWQEPDTASRDGPPHTPTCSQHELPHPQQVRGFNCSSDANRRYVAFSYFLSLPFLFRLRGWPGFIQPKPRAHPDLVFFLTLRSPGTSPQPWLFQQMPCSSLSWCRLYPRWQYQDSGDASMKCWDQETLFILYMVVFVAILWTNAGMADSAGKGQGRAHYFLFCYVYLVIFAQ